MDLELHDWEVLPDSDDSTSVQNTSYLEGIEHDSDGIIRSDYFSLDSHTKYAASKVEDAIDDVSVESDNPSWIDPVSDTGYPATKAVAEPWSSDGSDDGKYVESEANNSQVDIIETETRQVTPGEIDSKPRKLGEIDVGGEESEACRDEKIIEARGQGDNPDTLIESVKAGGEERNRASPVWWKLPLDLLKYCLFKASPVWTLSMAAAMMGVVILGRRLYKMRQKSRTLQLKVTMDDKKVSQFMSGAAKLNEAFSVVKRAPMIRPSMPGAVAPWPMMALR